jgi:hypothetical protein
VLLSGDHEQLAAVEGGGGMMGLTPETLSETIRAAPPDAAGQLLPPGCKSPAR